MQIYKTIFLVATLGLVHLSVDLARGQGIQGKLPSYEALINPQAEFKTKWGDPWIFEVFDDMLSKERTKRHTAIRFIYNYLYNKEVLFKDKSVEAYKHQPVEVYIEGSKVSRDPYLSFIMNAFTEKASAEHKVYIRLRIENIIDLLDSETKSESTIYLRTIFGSQAPFDTMNWRIVWPQTKVYQSLIPPIYFSTPLDPQSKSSEKTPSTSTPIVPSN